MAIQNEYLNIFFIYLFFFFFLGGGGVGKTGNVHCVKDEPEMARSYEKIWLIYYFRRYFHISQLLSLL